MTLCRCFAHSLRIFFRARHAATFRSLYLRKVEVTTENDTKLYLIDKKQEKHSL